MVPFSCMPHTIHLPQREQNKKRCSNFSLTFTKVIKDDTSVLKAQQTNLNALVKVVMAIIAFDLLLASQGEGVVPNAIQSCYTT